jgi:hypothetical protein
MVVWLMAKPGASISNITHKATFDTSVFMDNFLILFIPEFCSAHK